MFKLILIYISLLGLAYSLSGQNSLTEGIYLHFDDLRLNSPISIEQLSIPDNESPNAFINYIQTHNEITYFDQYGLQTSVRLSDLWAFFLNDEFYIKYENAFCRIEVFGVLCYFTAKIKVRKEVLDYNPYSQFSSHSTRIEETYELRDFILDLRTGEILESTPQNLNVAIADDLFLQREYNSLKKSKQQKLIFYYISRYNRSHPLTFSNEK